MPSERRLHPLSFLFSLGSRARELLIPGLVVLLAARSSTWQVWLMILFVPYTIASLVRYFSYRYRFSDDELVIRTGLIFRNERHIPYARIQNIGSVQNLLHRLVGVADVRVETAGGAEPEARIQVLSVKAMEEMRRRIFEQKALTAPEPAPQPEERVLLELGLTDLVIHGIVSNRGMVVAAAVAGVAWELNWFGDWSIDEGSVGEVTRRLGGAFSWAGNAALLLAGFLVLMLALRILSIGWAIVKLHGFRLGLAGRDLNLSCGLFTRVRASVPLHRIQLLTITERLLHRPFGCVEVRVDTAGGVAGEDQQPGVTHHGLAPVIGKERLPDLLGAVMPGIDLGTVEWRPVHPRAWRRLLTVYLLISAAVTIPIATLTGGWGIAALVPLAIVSLAAARGNARRMGWAMAGEMVLFRSGWLRRDVSMARQGKVQVVELAESPFDRRNGMASVRVDTAGAAASVHRLRIPFLPLDTARDLFGTLAARAAVTAFRW